MWEEILFLIEIKIQKEELLLFMTIKRVPGCLIIGSTSILSTFNKDPFLLCMSGHLFTIIPIK